MVDFNSMFSANALNMKGSVIRELLKLTARPDIISFAGGLPAPETFPVADLKTAADVVFDKHAAKALQYGTTEGDDGLKTELLAFESRQGVDIKKENLLVVSASQQALDMVCKVFLDPGDFVIVGRPTYVGGLQAIQSYRGKVIGVPFTPEQDGFDMAILEREYAKAIHANDKVKFIYVIPDFQNPAGFCWSLAKRKALLDFSYKNNLIIIEDSPYREIRFMGEAIPSIFQIDQNGERRGTVVNLKTFSKILIPGARVGWIMAHEKLISKFVIAKQSMDLCTNVFTQKWLAEYMKTGKLYAQIQSTCDNYREKRNHMMAMFEKYMPKRWEITWTKPEGGLFLWLTLPKFMDTDQLILKAVEQEKVAFVVGSAFYFDSPEHNSMRINFSYSDKPTIEEGVKRLARVILAELEAYEAGNRAKTAAEGI